MKLVRMTIKTWAQVELDCYYKIDEDNELTALIEDSDWILNGLQGEAVEITVSVEGLEFALSFVPQETLGGDDYIVILENFILGIEENLNAQDFAEKLEKAGPSRQEETKQQEETQQPKGMNRMNLDKLISNYFTEIDGNFLLVDGVEAYISSESYGPTGDDYHATAQEFYECPMWSTLWRPKYPTDDLLENAVRAGFDIYQVTLFSLRDGLVIDEFLALGVNGAGYDFYMKHWAPLFDLYLNS